MPVDSLNLETRPLSPRWFKLPEHPPGEAYSQSTHRFNSVPAGRRSLKTERFKRRLVKRALRAMTSWVPRFFAGAPTRDQAKKIFWDDLKALVGRDLMLREPSESELTIYTLNGAEIHVVGLDKPARIEGQPWDGGGLTEMGNMKPTVWPMHVRPALTDRHGWCDVEGVPEGRNHYHGIHMHALAEMQAKGSLSEWGAFTWPSSDILPPEEVEAMRRDLDDLTFEQECNASFISFEGRAYYPFLATTHTASLKYDERQPLIICFDFNVAPGVAAIIQEQTLPGQFVHDPKTLVPLLNRPIIGTGVIGEVHIDRNSNTPAVCRKILEMFGSHRGAVKCYGDATGGAQGSAKVLGSDWDLIISALRPKFGERLYMHVKSANPPERARVNAVNSRLRSMTGDIKLMVDPSKAPHVVTDFEGVTVLKGGSGELDKHAAPMLTHLTDSIGYYVESEFPVSGAGLVKMQLSGH